MYYFNYTTAPFQSQTYPRLIIRLMPNIFVFKSGDYNSPDR